MLNVQLDEETVNQLIKDEVKKKVDELAALNYFMTYKETLEYVRMSRPTFEHALLESGLLDYYKVGTKYLFKRSDVDEALDLLTGSTTDTNRDLLTVKPKRRD